MSYPGPNLRHTGANGAGKSTLMKILAGDCRGALDSGADQQALPAGS